MYPSLRVSNCAIGNGSAFGKLALANPRAPLHFTHHSDSSQRQQPGADRTISSARNVPSDLQGGMRERSELDGTMGRRASKSAAARALGPRADPESPGRPRVPDQREP